MLLDNRQGSTRRVAQSSTAARCTKPLRIGMQVMSMARAWLAAAMSSPRSKYGKTGLPGCLRRV
jgi:hypothetical protein